MSEIEVSSISSGVTFSSIIDDQEILSSLNKKGIEFASKVQAAAIPDVINGRDLVVQAQTGSGKTLAFAIPLIMKLRKDPKHGPVSALVVTPTRELATQVCDVVKELAPDLGVLSVIGGSNINTQIKTLRNSKPPIVVGTPGRLLDLMEQKELDLRQCRFLVLDEADEMLSMGFLEEVTKIINRIPRNKQGMFFSATVTPRVLNLARSFLKDFSFVEIESSSENTPEIEHSYFNCDGGAADKATLLCSIIEQYNPANAIVFCNTKSDTELVEVFLARRGIDAKRLNSDLPQKQRDAIMRDFKGGKLRFLVATDLAARGIDVSGMDMVINYSIPEQPEVYVHRSGRTGRAGRSGRSICLVGPQDFFAFHTLGKNTSLDFDRRELGSV